MLKRVDEFPTHEINGVRYRIGRVLPFGASIVQNGVNFSVFSKEATACELVLFHAGEEQPFLRILFLPEFRIGDVYSMMVYDLDIDNLEYGYCFDGAYLPQEGLWFDRTKIVLDPYAKSVSGRIVWGRRDKRYDAFPHRGRVIYDDFDWQGDTPLNLPLQDSILYELHVRGFTKHESSGVKYAGTFAGMREKISYLKELGITAVELLPIFAFDELENSRVHDGMQLYNYWGYSTVCFFAPKVGYAASGRMHMETEELKNLILQLHKNGIEVILDVVFNHTAEGNENGPTISYRGIDNRTYYLLTPEGYYYNFSGCGNTLNCNNSVVRNCILDCLRYWVTDYHVDGFRFDLASILARDENGAPMTDPPLLETLANDAVLGRTKLIAEAWDAGGMYQVGTFPSWGKWAEWNGKYRDCVRSFVKGNADSAPELFYRIGGSQDLYGNRSAEASVNFITCHDGFTLADCVSYNEKHNEANGENNQDGCNDNCSWNCGAEGETEDAAVLALRLRQMKNMLTLLLLSRGVPMLLAGDEFANMQHGNNNAYCQDNEISWLDWSLLGKNSGLHHFVCNLIAFRKAHPVLRSKDFSQEHNETGYPELSFHGTEPWSLDQNAPTLTFAVLYAESGVKFGLSQDSFLYIAVNAHWEAHTFRLPIIPADKRWHLWVDTFDAKNDGSKQKKYKIAETIVLRERSIQVWIAK